MNIFLILNIFAFLQKNVFWCYADLHFRFSDEQMTIQQH